ncbi:IS110 family transposase [Thermoanaerobacteraceae bacterium SP2]|nr:IS110 family transposase [Thermoanaerobacteraceae bacterium SP2]
MEVLYPNCCGLDVHKKSIVACAITPEGKEIQKFGTMTSDILSLQKWLKSKGCTCVAMESTGSYWKPIYNILEQEDIKIMVVNAQHIKTVPGRKTDVLDSEWIADLLRHGLLKGSFIPDRERRELRELVRYRTSITQERTREVNRLHKVLEGANIKLTSVVSDVTGVSSLSMIESIINGVEDPKVLAQLAKGRMRNSIDELEQALFGLVGPHQRMMLSIQLRHIDFLDEEIAKLDKEIEERMRPFEQELALLDTIPGVGRKIAEQIIAEIGTDMDQFPTAAHLASWVGICPGNNKSADKQKSGKSRKGNKSLKTALAEAAHGASKTKTYLSSQYHRIAARRGINRATVAVGHSILVIAYNILKRKQPYEDLGVNYFDNRKKDSIVKNAIKKLESLGYKVNLESVA